jgi:hypothetical protein
MRSEVPYPTIGQVQLRCAVMIQYSSTDPGLEERRLRKTGLATPEQSLLLVASILFVLSDGRASALVCVAPVDPFTVL